MNDNLLKYAIENDMIDLSYVQEQIEMNKRRELLEKHPYKIWEGKDGKWRTYLFIPDKGRQLKKRNSKKEIEDDIIKHYEKNRIISISDVFNEWINQKLGYEDIKKQTYDRYKTDFHRFFDGTNIIKTDIRKIEESDLEDFIRESIYEKKLTHKSYSGLRLIIIGIFKYAKKKKYTEISISQFFGDMELPKNAFQKRKFTKEESVFTNEEIRKIEEYVYNMPPSIINYGILLAFQTGVRVGELAALKPSDIVDDVLNINKTEVRYRGEDGKYVFEVRESAKTEAGNRRVILNTKALNILSDIQCLNPYGEYLFMKDGARIKEKAFSVKMVKICEYVGIPKRSLHKVRKTCATNLLNKGVDESLVIQQLGHTKIETTKEYYYFDNTTHTEAKKQIECATI